MTWYFIYSWTYGLGLFVSILGRVQKKNWAAEKISFEQWDKIVIWLNLSFKLLNRTHQFIILQCIFIFLANLKKKIIKVGTKIKFSSKFTHEVICKESLDIFFCLIAIQVTQEFWERDCLGDPNKVPWRATCTISTTNAGHSPKTCNGPALATDQTPTSSALNNTQIPSSAPNACGMSGSSPAVQMSTMPVLESQLGHSQGISMSASPLVILVLMFHWQHTKKSE